MATSRNETQAKGTGGAVDPELAGSGNLDKIRDILFGNQSKEYEKRFGGLEERLRAESGSLRADLSRRMDDLERYLKQEVQALLERIKKEQGERSDGLKLASSELERASKGLREKCQQIEEHIAASERALREQILGQSKSLGEEMRRHQTEGAAALGAAYEDLRSVKADRAALSAMFAELAMRLGEDEPAAGKQRKRG